MLNTYAYVVKVYMPAYDGTGNLNFVGWYYESEPSQEGEVQITYPVYEGSEEVKHKLQVLANVEKVDPKSAADIFRFRAPVRP